jgi:hypothetical protein
MCGLLSAKDADSYGIKAFPEYELLEIFAAAEDRSMMHEAWHDSSCLFASPAAGPAEAAAKSRGGDCREGMQLDCPVCQHYYSPLNCINTQSLACMVRRGWPGRAGLAT